MKKAVLLNDTSRNNHHGCRKVVSNLKYGLQQIGIDILDTSLVREDWSANKYFIDNLKKCDLVVVNGEGTIHHNSPFGENLLKVGGFAKDLHIPSVLINCTYEKNSVSYKEYLSDFSYITVRESFSQQELQKIDIFAEIVPDLTFLKYPNLGKDFSRNMLGTGITDSVYPALSEKLFEYTKLNKHLTFAPIVETNPNDLLFSRFSFLGFRPFSKLSFQKLIANPIEFYKKYDYNRKVNKYVTRDYLEYFNLISQFELVVTARFHALCFAIQSETSFLTLKSNSHKVEALLNDIGLSNNRIISIDDLSSSILSEDLSFSKDEKSLIADYKVFAKERFDFLLNTLKSI